MHRIWNSANALRVLLFAQPFTVTARIEDDRVRSVDLLEHVLIRCQTLLLRHTFKSGGYINFGVAGGRNLVMFPGRISAIDDVHIGICAFQHWINLSSVAQFSAKLRLTIDCPVIVMVVGRRFGTASTAVVINYGEPEFGVRLDYFLLRFHLRTCPARDKLRVNEEFVQM